MLLHGLVADIANNATRVPELPQGAGVPCAGEYYSPGGLLAREFRSDSLHTE